MRKVLAQSPFAPCERDSPLFILLLQTCTMLRKILFTFIFLLVFCRIQAQSNLLNPGDIAIIAFQSDNNDQFAFLCLVNIAPNTQIQFSEKGWNGSLPTPVFVSTTEGIHTWTAPNITLPTGTVVIIGFNNLGTAPFANYGIVQSTAAAKLSTSGDELLAFQGSITAPHFIYAFGSRPWITAGIPTSNQSWLPSPLLNGVTARDFATENDNQYFKLLEYADSKDSLLSSIGNTKNWVRSNNRFSNLPNWHFQILTHYFLRPQGNPIHLTSWGTLSDGSGITPNSFIASGNTFHISNQSGTILLTDNWNLDRLWIDKNQYLSINGFQLIFSALMDSSKGFIIGSDASIIQIKGKSAPLYFDAGSAILNQLILTAGASVSLQNTLKIVSGNSPGTVYLGDSSFLNTHGNLVLTASEKGSSSISSLGKNATIKGPVEVQKYIPAGKRNFRFLSHPFANPISLNQLTNDIDITGRSGSSNGFTNTNTNNPSAFWYNPLLADQHQNELGWIAFTNTNGLGNNSWNPKQGIRINLRGSKGEGLNGQPYLPSPILLHLKDSLNTGDQIVSLTKNTHNDGYNLIGNPFAAEIDMSKIQLGQNIVPNFYLWDPYMGTKGGYSCYPFSNSIYLPSFAAFFAQTIDSSMGNQLLFPESSKVNNSQSIRILGNTEKIKNQLEFIVEADSIIWDRALFIFNKTATDSVDFYDAKKMMNPDFSLFSWSAEKVKLCVDTRSSLHPTRIPMALTSSLFKTFQLKVSQVPEILGYHLYLIDKIAERKLLLKSGLNYSFQVDSLPELKDSIRFEIQLMANTVNTFNSIEVSKLICQLFPNPTNHQLLLNIQSPLLLPITISVTNSLGQIMLHKVLATAHQINDTILLDTFAAGIYFIQISNSEETIIQKIIKY